MEHKIGLLCGRFQPVHRGHIELIREALKHCDHLIIAIGSAQESGTKKNPFDYETRRGLLWRCLRSMNSRVTFIPVNDRENVSEDSTWGKYLMNEVFAQTGAVPTINFSGAEGIRSHWFDEVEIEQMEIDRNITPYSATKLREAILNDDYFAFVEMAPNGLYLKYRFLQKTLKEIYNEH
jgi:cytidyltransferase-like protein